MQKFTRNARTKESWVFICNQNTELNTEYNELQSLVVCEYTDNCSCFKENLHPELHLGK